MPLLQFRISLRLIIAAGLILSIIACQPTRHHPFMSGEAQSPHLQNVTQWVAKGKVSITFHDERQNASFTWEQDKHNYQIHLFGPLGQGSTWLRKKNQTVTLSSAKNQATANSAEQLMLDHLGWQVPVSNLLHWMKGLPASTPPPEQVDTDEFGFIETLQQEGWTVTYRSHQRVKGWLLPKKLVIQREGIRVLLVVKEWQLQAPPRQTAR